MSLDGALGIKVGQFHKPVKEQPAQSRISLKAVFISAFAVTVLSMLYASQSEKDAINKMALKVAIRTILSLTPVLIYSIFNRAKIPENDLIQKMIQASPKFNPEDPSIQEKMLLQLVDGETYTPILKNLYLGRAGDTEDTFDFVVSATAKDNLHPDLKNKKARFDFPGDLSPKDDVGIHSFLDKGDDIEASSLNESVNIISQAIKDKKKVLVCCQQGKDRSALVVLAYLIKEYNVTREQALNFVLSKRHIVSVNDIPEYWNILVRWENYWKGRRS